MMDVMNQMLREQDGSGAQYCMHGEGGRGWAQVGSRAAGVCCSSLVVSRGPGLRIVHLCKLPTTTIITSNTRCACPVLPMPHSRAHVVQEANAHKGATDEQCCAGHQGPGALVALQ